MSTHEWTGETDPIAFIDIRNLYGFQIIFGRQTVMVLKRLTERIRGCVSEYFRRFLDAVSIGKRAERKLHSARIEILLGRHSVRRHKRARNMLARISHRVAQHIHIKHVIVLLVDIRLRHSRRVALLTYLSVNAGKNELYYVGQKLLVLGVYVLSPQDHRVPQRCSLPYLYLGKMRYRRQGVNMRIGMQELIT